MSKQTTDFLVRLLMKAHAKLEDYPALEQEIREYRDIRDYLLRERNTAVDEAERLRAERDELRQEWKELLAERNAALERAPS